MVNKILKFRYLLKLFVFIPLTFYFGKRSYIAFDEGFYALKARCMLETSNWTIDLKTIKNDVLNPWKLSLKK